MKGKDEVLVGLLATVAVIVLLGGTYWLARGTFAGGYDLYTVVSWGQGVETGRKVLLAGVPIGRVEDVELRMEGTLVIHMMIEDKYKIPRGSSAGVVPVGFFGDQNVAITPGAIRTEFHEEGDTLPSAKAGPTPADVIAGADSVTRSLQAIMAGLHRELIDAGAIAQLRNTLASTNELVVRISSIAAKQSEELSSTMSSFRKSVAAVDSIKVDSTMRNLVLASAEIVSVMQGLERTGLQLSNIAGRLERGEGTAGKLLADTTLYTDLRSTVTNVNSLITDFKLNPRKYLDLSFSIFGGRRR